MNFEGAKVYNIQYKHRPTPTKIGLFQIWLKWTGSHAFMRYAINKIQREITNFITNFLDTKRLKIIVKYLVPRTYSMVHSNHCIYYHFCWDQHATLQRELSVFHIFAVLFVVKWESAVQFQVQFPTVVLLLRISKDFIRFHSWRIHVMTGNKKLR